VTLNTFYCVITTLLSTPSLYNSDTLQWNTDRKLDVAYGSNTDDPEKHFRRSCLRCSIPRLTSSDRKGNGWGTNRSFFTTVIKCVVTEEFSLPSKTRRTDLNDLYIVWRVSVQADAFWGCNDCISVIIFSGVNVFHRDKFLNNVTSHFIVDLLLLLQLNRLSIHFNKSSAFNSI